MAKFLGFGDLLARLSPKGYLRFSQAAEFDVNYTGAEANVCVSLSTFGVNAAFVSRVPQNDIGACALAELRKHGVDVSGVARGGNRLGIFYLEKGASQRASKCIYDRHHSSFCDSLSEHYDWDKLFCGVTHFHFTGITPALSESLPPICLQACKAAKERGIFISCDLNYRANLWGEQAAKETMEKLVPYLDLLIANEEDCERVLGISAEDTDITGGKLSRKGYADLAAKLCEKYGVKHVGITLRESISASDNGWSAMLYTGGTAYFSKRYDVHIVDRVGGGDSFAAGLIYSFINGFKPQHAVEFAAAASCLKHSIELDFNLATVDEVEKLLKGNGSGRVER